MDTGMKSLKWLILHGPLPRRFLLRAFLFALSMTIYPFIQINRDEWATEPFATNPNDCNSRVGSIRPLYLEIPFVSLVLRFLTLPSITCKQNENITIGVFKEMMSKNLLDSHDKALSVGEGSSAAVVVLQDLGFKDALAVERHPFFSLICRRFVYELDFDDGSFDFVFSKALDRVSVPALFIHEVERVLRPFGIGAMLVGAQGLYAGSLIRSATPVSSFLKSSSIVLLYPIGSSSLVVFQKKNAFSASLVQYRLPSECRSVISSKRFNVKLEPIVDEDADRNPSFGVSYLSKFMNVSSVNRIVYINIGAGQYLDSSIESWVKPYYLSHVRSSDIYFIDRDSLALSSYVRKAGITFVYNPDRGSEELIESEGFDFVTWFKNMMSDTDFIVVAMNSGAMEMKLLLQLLESGVICYVNELFVLCPGSGNAMRGECLDLLRSLRKNGFYVHQWWGD